MRMRKGRLPEHEGRYKVTGKLSTHHVQGFPAFSKSTANLTIASEALSPPNTSIDSMSDIKIVAAVSLF